MKLMQLTIQKVILDEIVVENFGSIKSIMQI